MMVEGAARSCVAVATIVAPIETDAAVPVTAPRPLWWWCARVPGTSASVKQCASRDGDSTSLSHSRAIEFKVQGLPQGMGLQLPARCSILPQPALSPAHAVSVLFRL